MFTVQNNKQFKFHCPHCGQRFAASFEKAGTTSRCTVCKEELTVPLVPSWQKIGFAKQVVPALISETPAILIRAAHSSEGLNTLKEAWREFYEDECMDEEYVEPDGLGVSTNREDGVLVISFSFPQAYRESEPYLGVAIYVAPEGQKLTNDTLRFAQRRYFLLSLYGGKSYFEEVDEGKVKSRGKGTSPKEPEEFIKWARRKCGLPEIPTPPGTSKNLRADTMEMAAAFAEARSTLNQALQRFLRGEYETFSVKVPITEGDKTEHLWLGGLKYYSDGTFSGIIEDKPKVVESVVQGQSCEVAYDDVTDWQSFHQGKVHGNYSLRATLSDMSSEEAAKIRNYLADLP